MDIGALSALVLVNIINQAAPRATAALVGWATNEPISRVEVQEMRRRIVQVKPGTHRLRKCDRPRALTASGISLMPAGAGARLSLKTRSAFERFVMLLDWTGRQLRADKRVCKPGRWVSANPSRRHPPRL
jgi:hypothetical protein